MNLLTNAIRIIYLAVGLLAMVFVTDFTGFDKEFGQAYHKYIKAPLIRYDVLKKRLATEPPAQDKKETTPKAEKVAGNPSLAEKIGIVIMKAADRLLSAAMDKLGNLLFSPFTMIAGYVFYVIYINKDNHEALASFRLI